MAIISSKNVNNWTADNDVAVWSSSVSKYIKKTIAEFKTILGWDTKQDKITWKWLSENDFTDTLKTKLDNIEAGAEVNTLNWDATITNATVVSALPWTPNATTLYLILE